MSTTVSVTTVDGTTSLVAPYDPTMPPKARAIGGRFQGATKMWMFDARDEQRVRDLAREVYGTDGASDEQTVTVRIDAMACDPHRHEQEIRLAGRRLAHRPSRDMPVRLDAGVVIVEGGFPASGGSVKNPRLETQDGTVLEVRDVPRSVADKMAASRAVTILNAAEVDREALTAERDRLLTRLAEINTLLD